MYIFFTEENIIKHLNLIKTLKMYHFAENSIVFFFTPMANIRVYT